MTVTKAEELVYAAIDEVTASFDKLNVPKAHDTPLVGETGGIDSLAVVSLVVALEARIAAATGKEIVLIDENFFDGEAQPLRTVGTLIAFTEDILNR